MSGKEKPVISVSAIDKSFKIPHERFTSLKQLFLNSFVPKKYEIFDALKNVTFDIRDGEFFGVIGRNGSGKSTLLKIIANIYKPSGGKVSLQGNLSPFIELGVGFNPELSARENVYLSGSILGLTRKEILEKFDTIVSFAELENFMDQKFKNFSSGMQVRLAFSIAIQAHSDVLLVDEVLAVGDASFQKKCFEVFRDLKKQGKTIVFVSHDMENIKKFCDRVLVLDHGTVVTITDPYRAIEKYNEMNKLNVIESIENSEIRSGTGRIKVKNVEFFDGDGKKTEVFKTGEQARIRIELESGDHAAVPIVLGFALYNSDGTRLAGPNSLGTALSSKDRMIDYTIEKIPLPEDTYQLSVAVFNENLEEKFDYFDKAFVFRVSGVTKEYGRYVLFGQWSKIG